MSMWFRRKIFGWGWTPVTWQGWLLTFGYAALIVVIVLFAPSDPDPNLLMRIVFVGIPILIVTALFIWICYKKGEKPRWQWGPEDEDKK